MEKGKLNGEDDDIDDAPGLYYPLGYVFDTWLEHRDHGLYPQRGGYDDQDWRLMRDWRTLDRRYNERAQGEGVLDNGLEKYTGKPITTLRDAIE